MKLIEDKYGGDQLEARKDCGVAAEFDLRGGKVFLLREIISGPNLCALH
jgi:hypothetical protein